MWRRYCFFRKNTVLKKYEVKYYRCKKCGSVQTETPYWLDEAYSNAITETDIGLCSRNIWLQEKISAIIKVCFSELPIDEKMLDYGGGDGMLVRLLRDCGMHFEWYDKYCKNIFSKTFEKSKERYKLVTAIELFEHFSNPKEEIKELLNLGENIIFTTEVLPDSIPKIDDWWYYSPETGQHVAFYSRNGLQCIAENNGLNYMGYQNIHILSQKSISEWKLRLSYKYSNIINCLFKRETLLDVDFDKIRKSIS